MSLHLELTSTPSFTSLIRIEVQLADQCETDELSGPFIPHHNTVRCQEVLQLLKTIKSKALPFAAWATGAATIQLVCPKAAVAKLFKLLHAEQKELGIRVVNVKTNVLMDPMSDAELLQACIAALHDGLEAAGWWRLGGGHFLGIDVMAAAAGKLHICPSLQLQLRLQPVRALELLATPSVVCFRRPAALPTGDAADLPALQGAGEGTICCVLPGLQLAIADRLRVPSSIEQQQLQVAWQAAGFALPAGALDYVVDVRFDCEADAPTRPFPPCCVLSELGLYTLHDKLDSREVQGVLVKLRDDIGDFDFGFWSAGQLQVLRARESGAAAEEAQPVPATLQTAREVMSVGAGSSAQARLGRPIDITSFTPCGEGGDSGSSAHDGGSTLANPCKTPHARATRQLLTFLAKEQAEAAEAAAVPMKPEAAAATSATRLPAVPVPSPGPCKLPNFKRAVATKRPPEQKAAGTAPTKKLQNKTESSAPVAGEGAAPAAPAARPRVKAADVDVAALDVGGLAAGGKLGTLTMPQLKAFCKSVELQVKGKKAELEARIKEHLGLG